MSFGFLGEFWNSITSATVGAVTYGTDFFQSIGNAVAGAIANIVLYPIKVIFDGALAVSYVFETLITLSGQLFASLRFLIIFLGGILAGFTTTPPTISGVFATSTVTFLQGIPMIGTITTVMGVGMIVVAVIATIKSINL